MDDQNRGDLHQRLRIVAVDDEAGILDLLRAVFSGGSGFEFLGTGRNGDEAVRLAVQHRPDVMLIDIKMPGTSGLEAAVRIRAREPGVCIVMLTACEDPESIRAALRAGVAEYLIKGSDDLMRAPEIVRKAWRRFHRLDAGEPGTVWAFYGVKGNAGCSTLAVNTAFYLGTLSKRVLLIDLDLRLGDCSLYLDLGSPRQPAPPLLEPRVVAGLDESEIAALVRSYRLAASGEGPALDVLESPGDVLAADPAGGDGLVACLDRFREIYDHVVVDLPPGRIVEEGVATVVDACDRLMIVLNQDPASLKALSSLARLLADAEIPAGKATVLLASILPPAGLDHREFVRGHGFDRARALEVPRDVIHCSPAALQGVPVVYRSLDSPLARFVGGLAEEACRPVR